ncbi:hypothetical protein ACH5RR_021310 [Cinchona calisaya]|uniref:Uncharacterized protein n=1 Tax=Cinchona calisaya TaxID=153742 RepID=A0ABD2ZGX4_9GENT
MGKEEVFGCETLSIGVRDSDGKLSNGERNLIELLLVSELDGRVKVELRLVKTYLLCARKFYWSSIQDSSVHVNELQLDTILLKLKDALLPAHSGTAPKFLQNLEDIQHLNLVTCRFRFQTLLEPLGEKLVFLYNFIGFVRMQGKYALALAQHGGVVATSASYLCHLCWFYRDDDPGSMSSIDSALNKLRLHKDDRGLNELKVESGLVKTFLLCDSKLDGYSNLKDSVCVNALHFYTLLVRLEDGLLPRDLAGEVSKFQQVLMTFKQEIRGTYARWRESSIKWSFLRSELHSSTSPWRNEFLHSLLENLEDILIWGEEVRDSRLETMLESLQERLLFLYNFICFVMMQGKHREKYNELHRKNKDLIGDVVKDAGVVIFSLYGNEIGEASAKEIDVKLFCILGKIKLMKAEMEEKYPVTLKFNFPSTNELGFINLLLENLKELAISSAKDRLGTIQHHQSFLESYLKKNEEDPTCYSNHTFENAQDHLEFFRSFLDNYMGQIQIQKHGQDLSPALLNQVHSGRMY